MRHCRYEQLTERVCRITGARFAPWEVPTVKLEGVRKLGERYLGIAAIRDEIGFDGLLMTDDLTMKALAGDPADLALASLEAGCDVALLCNADLGTRARVAEAAGLMTPPAQARAERVMALQAPAPALDIDALKAKLTALMNG